MKQVFNFLMAISLVFSLSACTLYHINSEDISTDYYPSKKSPTDVVYLEDINRPHEIIGYVTVNAERRQRISEIIEKMKRETGLLGGDAITNIKSDSTGGWKALPVQDLIGNSYVRSNFTATAVVFK
ncbi:MAG: hypothetical protein ACI9E5_000501 [Candidatus Omnitrophota bacterium]|jgi:hypothetical protein